MCKAFAAILALAVSSGVAFGQSYFQLEGRVTSGLSLFPTAEPVPSVPFDEYGLPAGGYPVDFVGHLLLGPADGDWSFRFVVMDAERAVSYDVGGPESVMVHPELMVNLVAQSSDEISIEFRNSPLVSEEFALDLNLASGSGSWSWRRDCPVCDLQYALPSATATIYSVRMVPEPGTSLLTTLAIGVVLPFTTRRRLC